MAEDEATPVSRLASRMGKKREKVLFLAIWQILYLRLCPKSAEKNLANIQQSRLKTGLVNNAYEVHTGITNVMLCLYC